MQKYWSIFKISFQQEFAYRVNFIMWRVRNVLQIFLIFFLWDAVFSNPTRQVFGYDRTRILTYVLGILVVKALVLSARGMDVTEDISKGDLSNYLVKPVNYFRYWFTRDVSSKALNIAFAAVEFLILFIILKPPFFFQTDFVSLLGFGLAIVIAIAIYFNLLFVISAVPFWTPELAWGSHFLVTFIMVEFLSGALFPMDILPIAIYRVVILTPFPYLIFFPIQTYLGKIAGQQMWSGLFLGAIWVLALTVIRKQVWKKGLMVYQAYGR